MSDKRGRRLWRWLAVYVVALVLSNVAQLFWGWPTPEEGSGDRIVTVEEVGEDGAGTGRMVDIGIHEYGDFDSSRKVMAFHGSPSTGTDYAIIGPMLGERAHVVAIDAPGVGAASGGWKTTVSMRRRGTRSR